ncbi:MAG: nucleotidyl transferase AbiEii/AbiGii toxin family protein [Candidatus Symbiothrix sp.]|jgi:predicted nucleotidyltransferase component of viral defense system|nr:nucleotidyl transferase AbiEii/AbiGii toxin family protein [Candidatus Symbiothrix sp.]
MILQSEILRIAEQEGVPPDTIDKNWVLGHFLAELFRSEWAQQYLVFKGGTCLKKCYFKDYRFSEDLDFTLINPDFVVTDKLIKSICENIKNNQNILFYPGKVEPITSYDKYCGYKTVIQFWGANHKRNQQPPHNSRWQTSIKIEMISFEIVVDKPDYRILYDEFSDSSCFEGIKIPCYSLLEIISEKFRALLQRSYSAPRDYYDLWHLLKSENIDWEKITNIFKQKLEYKNLIWNGYQSFFAENRLKSMKAEWKNSLHGHIRDGKLPDVEFVLSELKTICEKIHWE